MRTKLTQALVEVAADAANKGGRGRKGKAVKTIRGARDSFHRLRVGDYRVMYDLLPERQVLLVLGVVHRRDLERWIGNR